MTILTKGNIMEYPFISKMGHRVLSATDKRSTNKKQYPLHVVECKRCKEQYLWALYQANENKTCRKCQTEIVGNMQRSNHPAYFRQTLNGMKMRTSNPKNKSYHRYGGRGIKVCERWSNKDTGLDNFVKDMGERPNGFTIERIDNNGDYEPRNCKWATPYEQSLNRNDIRDNNRGSVEPTRDGFRSLVSLNGKRRYLGTFSRKIDAQRCIDEVVKCFSEYAFAKPIKHD